MLCPPQLPTQQHQLPNQQQQHQHQLQNQHQHNLHQPHPHPHPQRQLPNQRPTDYGPVYIPHVVSFSSTPQTYHHYSHQAYLPTVKSSLIHTTPVMSAPTSSDQEIPSPEEMPPILDDGSKPPYSYATLIGMAILRSPERKLTLAQIYKWINDTFAWYRKSKSGWQNSIRHNLSLNKAFRKQERPKSDPGKGNYWLVETGCEFQFIKGRTVKRPQQFITQPPSPPEADNTAQPVTVKPEPIIDVPKVLKAPTPVAAVTSTQSSGPMKSHTGDFLSLYSAVSPVSPIVRANTSLGLQHVSKKRDIDAIDVNPESFSNLAIKSNSVIGTETAPHSVNSDEPSSPFVKRHRHNAMRSVSDSCTLLLDKQDSSNQHMLTSFHNPWMPVNAEANIFPSQIHHESFTSSTSTISCSSESSVSTASLDKQSSCASLNRYTPVPNTLNLNLHSSSSSALLGPKLFPPSPFKKSFGIFNPTLGFSPASYEFEDIYQNSSVRASPYRSKSAIGYSAFASSSSFLPSSSLHITTTSSPYNIPQFVFTPSTVMDEEFKFYFESPEKTGPETKLEQESLNGSEPAEALSASSSSSFCASTDSFDSVSSDSAKGDNSKDSKQSGNSDADVKTEDKATNIKNDADSETVVETDGSKSSLPIALVANKAHNSASFSVAPSSLTQLSKATKANTFCAGYGHAANSNNATRIEAVSLCRPGLKRSASDSTVSLGSDDTEDEDDSCSTSKSDIELGSKKHTKLTSSLNIITGTTSSSNTSCQIQSFVPSNTATKFQVLELRNLDVERFLHYDTPIKSHSGMLSPQSMERPDFY